MLGAICRLGANCEKLGALPRLPRLFHTPAVTASATLTLTSHNSLSELPVISCFGDWTSSSLLASSHRPGMSIDSSRQIGITSSRDHVKQGSMTGRVDLLVI